jgi:hypothetical protein
VGCVVIDGAMAVTESLALELAKLPAGLLMMTANMSPSLSGIAAGVV